MTLSRLIAVLSLAAISISAPAANEDDVYLARSYLRCAAFYVFGSTSVTRPELKQQLRDLADSSLYSAELLMDKNRPVVKAEFDAAREKFFAELATEEVKSDPGGFLNYMGEYCTSLREKKPSTLLQKITRQVSDAERVSTRLAWRPSSHRFSTGSACRKDAVNDGLPMA